MSIFKDFVENFNKKYEGSDNGAENALEKFLVKLDEEHALQPDDVNYKEVEESDWTQDYKYQNREVTFKVTQKSTGEEIYICIDESRSGSPFSDWHYALGSACQVKRATLTTVTVEETFVGMSWEDKQEYVAVKVTGENRVAVADQLEELITAHSEGVVDAEVEFVS